MIELSRVIVCENAEKVERMALEFLFPLSVLYPDTFGVLNVIQYISFRSAMAAATAMVLGIWAGPWLIRRLIRMKIGQTIRGEGVKDLYEKHKDKAGTPTMGGTLILASLSISTLIWGDFQNPLVWTCLIVTLSLGVLGFADDYIKLKRKEYKGVHAKQKLWVQMGVGLALGTILYIYNPVHPDHGFHLSMPFLKNVFLPLGIFYIPFVAVYLTGFSNAVNLTDGLDGLASGCVVIASVAFAAVAYAVGRIDWSAYLGVQHIALSGEITVFVTAVAGAALAFLWYNAHPAQVFMGDTGSLALGGAIGTVAILIKQELLLVIIGAVFVAEALSVMIQVGSYKYRNKKRVFLMAPLHHHFEMLGWKETQIVVRFWIIAFLFACLGLATLKVR